MDGTQLMTSNTDFLYLRQMLGPIDSRLCWICRDQPVSQRTERAGEAWILKLVSPSLPTDRDHLNSSYTLRFTLSSSVQFNMRQEELNWLQIPIVRNVIVSSCPAPGCYLFHSSNVASVTTLPHKTFLLSRLPSLNPDRNGAMLCLTLLLTGWAPVHLLGHSARCHLSALESVAWILHPFLLLPAQSSPTSSLHVTIHSDLWLCSLSFVLAHLPERICQHLLNVTF